MKAISLTLCSCNRYLDRNLWKPYRNIEALISDKVKKQFPKAKLVFKSFEMPMNPKEKKQVEIIAKIKDKEHVVPVILKLVKCGSCAKEGTKYFEAILQVRCSNYNILEKSIEFLQKRVEALRHRGMFINKVDRLDDGYDLYVTNKKIAMSLGKEL